jgi:hypothetical protein
MKKTFQPFYDRPETIQYKTTQIGNNYGSEYEIKKSTFNSVSDHNEVNFNNFIYSSNKINKAIDL